MVYNDSRAILRMRTRCTRVDHANKVVPTMPSLKPGVRTLMMNLVFTTESALAILLRYSHIHKY